MYAGAPKHPIFSGSTFGLMSGEKPLFQPQVQGGHEALGGALTQMGLHFEPTSGKYKEPERSYIIHNPTLEQMQQLGKMFGQESIVHSQNGQHRLVYTNGEHENKYHAAQHQTPVEHFEQPPPDFYTTIPGHGHMRINFDWNQMHPLDPIQKAERELTPAQAAHLAKNAVAQLLQAQAPVKSHPHAYDWHDGHTDHHQEDLAGPQLPGLAKASDSFPHMDAPPKIPGQHPTNEQAAGVGVHTYKQYALPYGNVQTGRASELLHYPYHGKLPEIEKLVADHGYKTYYAGGKYGKPDLASKNYNTGHLMVYDPTPDSGASFGHEEYTRGWRQIHELAHALTYPELNKIYGEGRRMGKLGTHRSTHEALRAVHWEWLAAHKQRELSKQVGVNIKDEDFHRELNTVMHDAAHRAVTGKFTEPSGEGFVPHAHKVPLHTALQMVRDAGHQMGLKGLHETLKKTPMQKAEGPGAPQAPQAPAAAPAMDNTVEGFMVTLKKFPKGDPRRGKHITAHMHHAPFLNALSAHPQGKQIHAMLTQHLNSTANAGLGAGMKVTAKSEGRTAIYSSAEGDTSVADEKTYTPDEANQILLKATREKVEAFEKEIKALRDRELKKALIPSHKHNQATQSSSGIEDVPPGKSNPKGIDKGMEKNAQMGYGPSAVNQMATGGGAGMSLAEKKAEALCKKCGKGHGELEKCGDIMPGKVEKADLHSEKGKRTDNHTVAGSKLPDDAKSKQVNEGTSKDPGSGGIKLPGSNLKKNIQGGPQIMGNMLSPGLKKANPPMAAPPSGKNMGTAVPTSAPKAPAMKAEKKPEVVVTREQTVYKDGLEKAALPTAPKAQAQQHAVIAGSKAAAGAGPAAAPAPKLPGAADQAARASGFQAAAAGAFQPKGPISSGLDLAPKAGAAPKLPGASLGLKSPKAAGVTRGAMSAGPVQNAARPAGAKPGIFGKLFGKGEPRPEVVPQNSPEDKKFREDNKAATAAGKKGVPVKPGDGVAKADSVPDKHKAKIAGQDAKMPKPIRDVMSPPDKATQTLFEDPEPKVLHPSDKKGKKK
jgi:hypothetical protein